MQIEQDPKDNSQQNIVLSVRSPESSLGSTETQS